MKKGFTLIEILIVLAIIGLFLAFILTSLSGGKKRADDNRYKTAIATSLAQAENYRSINGTYSGACKDSLVQDPLKKVGLLSPSGTYGQSGYDGYCFENGNNIAFFAKIRSTSTSAYFCVDSQGGDSIASSPTSYTCP